MGAFFEAHIEQRSNSLRRKEAIGIVRLGKVIRWYNIEVIGRPLQLWHHANALRKDAMLAAASDRCRNETPSRLRHENG